MPGLKECFIVSIALCIIPWGQSHTESGYDTKTSSEALNS